MRGFALRALANDARPFVTCLDTPLFELAPGAYFSARMACEGIHAFGRIGAGKSSAGKTIAGAYLRAGMGGVVCVAKPEEVGIWIDYARKNGRAQDVVLFNEDKGLNFLTYELSRLGMKGIGAVTECLMHILEACDHAMGTSGQASDPFWPQSVRTLINYTLPVLYSAWGTVSIPSIIDFVVSAATKSADQYLDPAFTQASFAARTMRQAIDAPAVAMPEVQQRTLLEYWFKQFVTIPDKTRGNIVISLTAKLDRFLHGRMRMMFCGRTTIVPEMVFHGAIIILCMPVLGGWNEDGIIGQQLFKYCFQRAVESRGGLGPRQRERFVFLWCDESQYFVNTHDDEFLSTCRAARACVVYLTQSLPSYYARLGERNRDAADGLVGKFSTQVFFQNACSRTNKYASDIIGRDIQWRATQGGSVGSNMSRGLSEGTNVNRGANTSHGATYGNSGSMNSSSGTNSGSGENYGVNFGKGTNTSESWSQSQQMDAILEPNVFSQGLKSGGPKNGNLVTAIWFQAGAAFAASNGGNWLRVTFRQ